MTSCDIKMSQGTSNYCLFIHILTISNTDIDYTSILQNVTTPTMLLWLRNILLLEVICWNIHKIVNYDYFVNLHPIKLTVDKGCDKVRGTGPGNRGR